MLEQCQAGLEAGVQGRPETGCARCNTRCGCSGNQARLRQFALLQLHIGNNLTNGPSIICDNKATNRSENSLPSSSNMIHGRWPGSGQARAAFLPFLYKTKYKRGVWQVSTGPILEFQVYRNIPKLGPGQQRVITPGENTFLVCMLGACLRSSDFKTNITPAATRVVTPSTHL